MRFADRSDAGRRLAAVLAARYAGQDAVVLALPRGGVPVAAEVAAALGAPLDLLIVRKVGVPFEPEVAMGAVVAGTPPIVVRNEDVIRACDITAEDFERASAAEFAEIERRRQRYLGTRPPVPLAGRVAIVVDDGIATGATMKAALRAVARREPRELVLAVPVAPAETLADLAREVDAVVCLSTPSPFDAIGRFYDRFDQLADAAVIETMARFSAPAGVKD
ncbi:phosphoribosyltransferase [Zavarzinia sp.]|uniref:phosphoribosyltransferase n=1 Tax=Zavarzinia sp. TaxID=2027920 RepID=UPI00356A9147